MLQPSILHSSRPYFSHHNHASLNQPHFSHHSHTSTITATLHSNSHASIVTAMLHSTQPCFTQHSHASLNTAMLQPSQPCFTQHSHASTITATLHSAQPHFNPHSHASLNTAMLQPSQPCFTQHSHASITTAMNHSTSHISIVTAMLRSVIKKTAFSEQGYCAQWTRQLCLVNKEILLNEQRDCAQCDCAQWTETVLSATVFNEQRDWAHLTVLSEQRDWAHLTVLSEQRDWAHLTVLSEQRDWAQCDCAQWTRILTRACTCSSSAETWAMRRKRRRFRMAWLERLCRSYITWFCSSKISPLRMLISSTGGPPGQACYCIRQAKCDTASRSHP